MSPILRSQYDIYQSNVSQAVVFMFPSASHRGVDDDQYAIFLHQSSIEKTQSAKYVASVRTGLSISVKSLMSLTPLLQHYLSHSCNNVLLPYVFFSLFLLAYVFLQLYSPPALQFQNVNHLENTGMETNRSVRTLIRHTSE